MGEENFQLRGILILSMEGDFFLSKQGFRLFLLQIFLKNRFVPFGRILARRSETDIYVMRSFSERRDLFENAERIKRNSSHFSNIFLGEFSFIPRVLI